MIRRGARSVYWKTELDTSRPLKLTLLSRDFYKSCIKPKTDSHEDHVADLIRRVSRISPCISFYVLSHRDVDWALLSLVMRSDRCTWLASCYVTHIRFHWQEIYTYIRKWRILLWISLMREEMVSSKEISHVLLVKTDIRRVSISFYC